MTILYGGMPTEDREKIKAAFLASPMISPVRILLSTDAASEGIDLQNHCSRLFHYEIPWNPMRMEQRNGRVDRHGQKDNPVQVFHFVGRGFKDGMSGPWAKPGKLEGDLEFLYRTAAKVDQIREDLGKVGPVIAEQAEEVSTKPSGVSATPSANPLAAPYSIVSWPSTMSGTSRRLGRGW